MKPGEVLFLSRSDVEMLLAPKRVLTIVEQSFKWIGEGKVKQVRCDSLSVQKKPESDVSLRPYPAYIEPWDVFGNKWLGGGTKNREQGLPHITAVNVINDGKTGLPLAIMDGSLITALRTGGHAAIGAKYLAEKDSQVVAMIGCGQEARTHLTMLNELFEIKKVHACDIVEEVREKYVEEMGRKHSFELKPFRSAKEAVKDVDIICMVTSQTSPVVVENWIETGTHVCGTTGFKDLDPRFSQTADKWVLGVWDLDLKYVEQDPRLAEVVKKENVYADMVQLVRGEKPGREDPRERTVMTHGGMGVLDLGLSYEAYNVALKRDIGKTLTLF